MPHYCFTLQVRPELREEYVDRHAAVWPEMLRALRDAGWRDYRLYLRTDGLLVGTVEADDLAAAQGAMAATDVNTRWQAEMSAFFVELPGGSPDTSFHVLEQVFDLDAQLAAAETQLAAAGAQLAAAGAQLAAAGAQPAAAGAQPAPAEARLPALGAPSRPREGESS